MTDPHASFDAAFAARAPGLGCRPERAADAGFLTDLFIACSPLRTMLPVPMLVQQAAFQHAAHRAEHPNAMWRVTMSGDRPIGRIVVDWSGRESYGVDIAALPDARATGVGLHMLRAWIDVVDRLGLPARLDVRADNPARNIYRRLGFAPAPDKGIWSPVATMLRPARA